MFCKSCGFEIESDSKFCRECGASQATSPAAPPATIASPPAETSDAERQRPSWGIILAAGGAVVAIVLVIGLGQKTTYADGNSSNTNLTAVEQASFDADNAMNAAIRAADAAENAVGVASDETGGGAPWSYSTNEDKVRGGTTYYATTTSTNSIHQNPPYDPATTMDIMVRKSPAYGTDVILTISSGQMMCPSYEGCTGTVRFDDGQARQIWFNGPADSSSDTIFVEDAQSFIAKLKKAKKIVVEKTLYEAGNPQFEFDVSGLKWDH